MHTIEPNLGCEIYRNVHYCEHSDNIAYTFLGFLENTFTNFNLKVHLYKISNTELN